MKNLFLNAGNGNSTSKINEKYCTSVCGVEDVCSGQSETTFAENWPDGV